MGQHLTGWQEFFMILFILGMAVVVIALLYSVIVSITEAIYMEWLTKYYAEKKKKDEERAKKRNEDNRRETL